MIVYHGSYTKINKIDLSKCENRRDFGKGFYVTNIRKQAEEWAEKIATRHHSKAIVTEFTFFESAFTEWHYKVLRFDGYNNEWLDFVVLNRNPESSVPTHNYDIVEGPVADDKIQRRLSDYLDGKISREKFLDELWHKKEPSHQICFCTARALLMLKNNEKIDIEDSIADIGEPLLEQLMLDKQIDEEMAIDLFYSSATFAQLTDETTKLYEKPWQQIYEMLKNEL
ncbi:MAG: DUF3990 domain-containing protein [Prevotellaceae bacterium]|jgi:hypothetical protein|nr:DUF3990 domain-containing protein [Prevotellaceae bacterium]